MYDDITVILFIWVPKFGPYSVALLRCPAQIMVGANANGRTADCGCYYYGLSACLRDRCATI